MTNEITAKENLTQWLKLHSLPAHFPKLKSVDFDLDHPFLRDNGRDILQVIEQIQGSFRSMIIFPPGQGTTTLLKAVMDKILKSEPKVPNLLIRLDMVEMEKEDDLSEAFSIYITREIFRQLLKGNWSQRLFGRNRQRLVQLFDLSYAEDLERLERQMRANMEPEKIVDLADNYEERLVELYTYLYSQLGLSVTLCFDFPHEADEEIVLETVREVKWFDENEKTEGFSPAALREAYFLNETQAQLMRSVWQVEFSQMVFRPYNRGEIYSIFSHQFQPKANGRYHPLINVFSDEFLEQVWTENKPLKEIADQMHDLVLTALDRPRGKVDYHLEPSEVKEK